MPNKEQEDLQEILDSYKWIKVRAYSEADLRNPCVEWKSEYQSLARHHKTETEFLINKCRELALKLINKENEKNV